MLSFMHQLFQKRKSSHISPSFHSRLYSTTSIRFIYFQFTSIRLFIFSKVLTSLKYHRRKTFFLKSDKGRLQLARLQWAKISQLGPVSVEKFFLLISAMRVSRLVMFSLHVSQQTLNTMLWPHVSEEIIRVSKSCDRSTVRSRKNVQELRKICIF